MVSCGSISTKHATPFLCGSNGTSFVQKSLYFSFISAGTALERSRKIISLFILFSMRHSSHRNVCSCGPPSGPVCSDRASFGMWYSMAFRYKSSFLAGSSMPANQTVICPTLAEANAAMAARTSCVALFGTPARLPPPVFMPFAIDFVRSLSLFAIRHLLHCNNQSLLSQTCNLIRLRIPDRIF